MRFIYKRSFLVIGCCLLFCLSWLPARAEVAKQQTAPKYGKYVNSMLVRTRTAATYPKGLKVFTLVGIYQDFDERRHPETGAMQDLPAGVSRQQLTALLWGEIGITRQFQVGAAIPYINRRFEDRAAGIDDSVSGISDVKLYGKYQVLPESRLNPAIAVDGFLKLPTGDADEGLGNDETDVTLGLAVSKRLTDISAHINPEYTFTGGDKSDIGLSADDRVNLNAGVMYHATSRLVPMLEINALWWGDVGDRTEIGGGVLWFPLKNVSLKTAISVPVDADMPWQADWIPWVKLAAWF